MLIVKVFIKVVLVELDYEGWLDLDNCLWKEEDLWKKIKCEVNVYIN